VVRLLYGEQGEEDVRRLPKAAALENLEITGRRISARDCRKRHDRMGLAERNPA
jgi:hypothetical protein